MQNKDKYEINALDNRIKESEIVKHTIKDSVFSNLFQDKKYLFQLYKALHPEDMDTTEGELTNVTIHNILTNDIYNDVGFVVGEKLLILTEAQSTWSENIVVRILIYLMVTYQDYIKQTKQNVYGSKKVKLLKPELYVIYTGDRKNRPEYISLTEEFFGGQEGFLEAKVKVLYGNVSKEIGEDDIVGQYVTFTKVYHEQMKQNGRTREAIMETIRICKNKNVLKEYLESKEKEVVSIMLAMLDEKEILLDFIESERYEAARAAKEEAAKEAKKAAEVAAKKAAEAAEAAAKKAAEAAEAAAKKAAAKEAAEAAAKKAKETVIQMLKVGKMSAAEIAQCVSELSVEDVKKLQEELS